MTIERVEVHYSNQRKHRMTPLRIAIETPDQPEVLALLVQPDAYEDNPCSLFMSRSIEQN
jgi:hypothetical protein